MSMYTLNGTNVTYGNLYPCNNEPFMNYEDLTQKTEVVIIFIVFYVTIMVLSIVGNLLVIWIVFRHRNMRTVTNMYIVNMAVGDFLVSVLVVPLKLIEYTAPCQWDVYHSDVLCSLQFYILPIIVFSTVLTLVAISLERFYAIVHPLASLKIHSKARTQKILVVTWLLPAILAAPYLYCETSTINLVSDIGQVSRQICIDKFENIDVLMYGKNATDGGSFRRGYFISLFVIMYVIPTVIIVGTSVRIVICLCSPINPQMSNAKQQDNKRKVARMMVVVASAFVASWMPFYLVNVVSQLQTFSFLRQRNFLFVMLIIHLLGFTNSCANPFIYNSMSEKFRDHFSRIFNRILLRRSRKRHRYRGSYCAYSLGKFSSQTQNNTEFIQLSPSPSLKLSH